MFCMFFFGEKIETKIAGSIHHGFLLFHLFLKEAVDEVFEEVFSLPIHPDLPLFTLAWSIACQ